MKVLMPSHDFVITSPDDCLSIGILISLHSADLYGILY